MLGFGQDVGYSRLVRGKGRVNTRRLPTSSIHTHIHTCNSSMSGIRGPEGRWSHDTHHDVCTKAILVGAVDAHSYPKGMPSLVV